MEFIGVRLLKSAERITKLEYCEDRGWTLPTDENPEEYGYKIELMDGTVSWCKEEEFNEMYRPVDAMTFGLAVEAAKQGSQIARKGWNGKGQFVYYVPGGMYKSITDVAKTNFGDFTKYDPYLVLKTVDKSVSTWVPSINDVLAEDWIIIN